MDTIAKINQLDEFMCQRDMIAVHKQEAVDAVLTPEIKAQLAEIDAEFKLQSLAVDENIEALTAEIKPEVIKIGATVKGERLSAVFSKGRVSWDTKALDGYAAAHPEVAQFRKEGEPSVSIRKIG